MYPAVAIQNVDSQLLHLLPWKKAMRLFLRGAETREPRVKVIEFTDIELQNGIFLPKKLQLIKEFRRSYGRSIRWNASRLKIRDGNRCRYCGVLFPAHLLTVDHVIAKSRGGLTTWENTVAACEPCNTLKSDWLPSECGLTLIRGTQLIQPTILEFYELQLQILGLEPNFSDLG